MNTNIKTAWFATTTSRLAMLAAAAVAASLIVAPALAQASTDPPPPTVTPIATQPTRTAGPTPTSPAYVAPVLLPTKDYITSTVNDPQGDLTLSVKTTSKALAPFASAPSTLVGRILVTTPAGQPQMVAQVTSATESATEWTIVTKRVSAFAALKPGDYAIRPDFARARFTTASGVTMSPIAATGTGTHTATETYELGPYTQQYSCGSGEVDLKADLRLTPWIDAGADFGWFSLDSAHLIAGLDETATLSASTTGPADTAAKCTKKKQLGVFTVPIDIGPVVAKVTFSLTADLTATLKGTVTTSVTQSFSGEAGVQYNGDSWSIVDGANDQISSSPPSIKGMDKIEAGLTAEAKLSFYDIISARLDLRAYAGMQLQQPPAPAFDLYAGAKLTYEIDAAGFDVFDDTLWSTGDVSLFHTPVVTTTNLPGAHWGPAGYTPGSSPTYSTQLAADGGSGSISYALVGGALPTGLRLSPSGLISGTPTLPVVTCSAPCTPAPAPDQTFKFTVQVTDSVGFTGSRQLSITVATVHVTTSSLPTANVGKSYSATLHASGVVGSASWQVVGGRLPSGLILSASGRISGVSNTPSTVSFTVKVTDSTGQFATATKSITTVCQTVCQ